MSLTGKGFMIWKIKRCENGNAEAIAAAAQQAGLTHVLIKIANGILPYNIDDQDHDLVPSVVQSLRARGISVWGWHYVYGSNPKGEASIAVKRTRQFDLDGYVIDAEIEYKQPGKANAARVFMKELRKGIPNTPVGLSSYRFPSYHPELPWKEFLEKCDYNMPQVYWEKAHNAGAQLKRSVEQFQIIKPFRPIIPTGPIYKGHSNWNATPEEIKEFLDTARQLNLQAANFYEWYYGRTILKSLWNVVAAYPWTPYPVPINTPRQLIQALNSHSPDLITALYTDDAVHITKDKTIQGKNAIIAYYQGLLSQTMPNSEFLLTGTSSTGNTYHFTWAAHGHQAGIISDGNDTIGMLNGKIAYHYSFYSQPV